MIAVSYRAADGTTVSLTGNGYWCEAKELLKWKWQYDSITRADRLGSDVTGFYMTSEERTVTVSAYAFTTDRAKELLNTLHDRFETDLRNRTPGRMYVGGYYFPCYVVSGAVSAEHLRAGFATMTFTVLPTVAMWHTERTVQFLREDTETAVEGGKRYNGRYPYRYATGFSSSYIDNSCQWPAAMRIRIFGPFTNPSITIGGIVYGASLSISDGEYIEIDQYERTVTLVRENGARENIFSLRMKQGNGDSFALLPPGRSAVQYNGLSAEVDIIEQRSEPPWT